MAQYVLRNVMIKSISIQNIASFAGQVQEIKDTAKVNFIFGTNGTGKTTISRVIAGELRGEVTWERDAPLNVLVYNRDFVEKNFFQVGK